MSRRTTAAVWVKGIAEMLAAEGLDARALLVGAGIDPAALDVLFAHFADCEARGKLGHGFSRIPWLVEQPFDFQARASKRSSVDGIDRWDGNGALGYLTLSAVCVSLVLLRGWA